MQLWRGKWEEMEKWVTGGGYKGAIGFNYWERVGSWNAARREIGNNFFSS